MSLVLASGMSNKDYLILSSYLQAKKSKKRAAVRICPEISVRCQRPQVTCMHPCYFNEMLISLALRSCSLLCAPLATVLHSYNALFTSPNRCACFVHTQNSRRCLVIKIGHGNPLSSFRVSKSSSNRSKRSYWVLPHAFIVSHHSGSSSVITGECDRCISHMVIVSLI